MEIFVSTLVFCLLSVIILVGCEIIAMLLLLCENIQSELGIAHGLIWHSGYSFVASIMVADN